MDYLFFVSDLTPQLTQFFLHPFCLIKNFPLSLEEYCSNEKRTHLLNFPLCQKDNALFLPFPHRFQFLLMYPS